MADLIALIVTQDRRIVPFDEPARDVLVLNERLGDHQGRVLAGAGIPCTRLAPEGLGSALAARPAGAPTLVFHEHLYFTPELLREFLERSSAASGPATRACLKKGAFTRLLAVLQDAEDRGDHLAFPLWFCAGGALEPAVDVVLDVDEGFESGNFPSHMLGKDNFRFPVTTRALLALSEPLHIGLANLAANFARAARYKRPGLWPGLKAAAAALTAFSLDRTCLKSRALRALSTVHPTAEVHPTAVIEGSVVGPRAKVGAYAVVRFSVLGPGAFVDDHAGVKFSVIGDGAYVANNNVVFFCTVYPGAFLISGPYQFCCFGRDTAIMNSIPADYRLDGGTIKVQTEAGLRDTGLRFAGSIFGHGTRVAAGLIIGPGRVIPGGLTLYPDPARVLNKVDVGGRRGVFFLKDGKLTDAP